MPIRGLQNASHIYRGVCRARGDQKGVLEEDIYERKAIRSRRNNESTCKFPLNIETVDVPVVGARGALWRSWSAVGAHSGCSRSVHTDLTVLQRAIHIVHQMHVATARVRQNRSELLR